MRVTWLKVIEGPELALSRIPIEVWLVELRQLKSWTERKAIPFGFRKSPPTTKEEVTSLIMHHFPPRNETFVQVFDFGDHRAKRNEIRLGDTEAGTASR